jgi:N-acetyltransferase
VFAGQFVQLEPLTEDHIPEIAAAVGPDRSTYQWAPVPQNTVESAAAAVAERLRQAASGSWIPYVQRRLADHRVVGVTNYLNVERWNGPGTDPTSVEIGGTWLCPDAQRSPINSEAKLLLLANAFDTWKVVRVQIKTDARNERSRAAILGIGATFEGVLRNYQPGNGDTGTGAPRSTAMYSVLPDEWPTVRGTLMARLAR